MEKSSPFTLTVGSTQNEQPRIVNSAALSKTNREIFCAFNNNSEFGTRKVLLALSKFPMFFYEHVWHFCRSG